MDADTPFLTLEEAARLLRVAPRSLRRWCVQRRIPARRIGRRWLFDAAELRTFVLAQSTQEGSHGRHA